MFIHPSDFKAGTLTGTGISNYNHEKHLSEKLNWCVYKCEDTSKAYIITSLSNVSDYGVTHKYGQYIYELPLDEVDYDSFTNEDALSYIRELDYWNCNNISNISATHDSIWCQGAPDSKYANIIIATFPIGKGSYALLKKNA